MRNIFAGILILICVFILGAVSAAENQMGIQDSYKVNFSEQVRVADTLLPKGDYQIRHVIEGSDHIMVFTQLGTKKPVEVRAKCTLVPLAEKADKSEKTYTLNAANERVLQELVFKGDRAKHVF
jgi:ABC-type oligopeptide transport system substrate-binding subunit